MLKVFSFGYWGWSKRVNYLVEMVDGFEAEAGFHPPIWVDIRHRREVSAPGFRGDALKNIVGGDRYVWMQELGNGAMETDQATTVKIDNPKSVSKLLQLAQDKAYEGRRLLFFCACHFPYYAPIDCHRATVAELLVRESQNDQIPVEVVEWPGGKPAYIQAEINKPLFRAIANGRNLVPLESLKTPVPRVLPYCSIMELFTNAGDPSLLVLTGPAQYAKDWSFPVFALWSTEDPGVTIGGVLAEARDYQRVLGFESLRNEP
jgi:hypothetical protein